MRTDSAQLPRNDPRQYDDLAEEWWAPRGAFAMLHWIAATRATLVPPAGQDDALLLDIACGGGVMAPHVQRLGYRHVGVDLGLQALQVARPHGVTPVRGDAVRLPFADGVAEVVVAGEMLEHVTDLYVRPRELVALAASHGVSLRLRGLRPSVPAWLAWLAHRREAGRMVPTRSTAVMFTGVGTKA